MERMHRVLDRLDIRPDIFVRVRRVKVTIDPRGCSNAAIAAHICVSIIAAIPTVTCTKSTWDLRVSSSSKL